MYTTPHESSKCRREVLFAIAVCLTLTLLTPICARAARVPGRDTSRQQTGKEAADTRSPQPARRQSALRRSWTKFADFLTCRSVNRMKRQELLVRGPQFPDSYDPTNFSIQALVGSEWPMLLEYVLETGGTLIVTVRVMNEDPFTRTFQGDGMNNIRVESFTLPKFTRVRGPGPYPALISFETTRLSGPGKRKRAAFALFGTGAGPKAFTVAGSNRSPLQVASLGGPRTAITSNALALTRAGDPRAAARSNLYEVTFEERQGVYICGFKVGDDFDRWSMEVRKHLGRLDKVWGYRDNASIGPHMPVIFKQWDGRSDRGRPARRGQYKAWIFVWNSGGDASWNTATSTDHADSSSWVEVR